MKKSRGFTLVEVMAVIVILGILAAVIMPRVVQFRKAIREAPKFKQAPAPRQGEIKQF